MRGRTPRVPMWLGLVAVGVAWAVTYNRSVPQSVTDVVFAVPFALVVIGAARADLEDRRGMLRHRFLVYAGQVSFAFYLVHELVLLNGELVWGDGPAGIGPKVLLTLAVTAVCFLLAMALHEGVEKPAQAAIRAWSRRHSDATGATPTPRSS